MWSDYQNTIKFLIEEAELSEDLFDEHKISIKKSWENGESVEDCFEKIFDRYL